LPDATTLCAVGLGGAAGWDFSKRGSSLPFVISYIFLTICG